MLRHIKSESIIGLSHSLVAAGVSSVMVSLWSIPDVFFWKNL
ncbi:MAG: CHAT domain-containing protein [Moorea sp. SIOASIH]|nr:CHAT domain-containing protein [Moorena sp. SIOASIH]NEO40520.1 CHAT domain-containing protein [Moorena sp. SIOASIH]